MKPLDVLVVNLYYPPDTSATAVVFADITKALAAADYRVTVLTGRPSYDPTERRPWRPFAREVRDGVVIERVGSTAIDRRRRGGRAANYLSFVPLAAIRALLRPRPDVVVAGSDPFLAVWVGLAAARGRPVIYSLQDLNPDAGVAGGLIKPRATTRLWDRLHRLGMRRCASVVTLGETMRGRVIAKGVSAERVAVVPNGAWPAEGEPDPKVVEEIRAGASFVAMHAGNLSVVGAWDSIIEAGSLLGDAAALVFVGGGYEDRRLRGKGVRLLPFRPREQVPSVMAAGELQIVSLKRGLEGLSVPSKAYAILAHGRPLLAVVPEESEIAQMVREHGCGLVADPEDPRNIAGKITWAAGHPKELAEMARRAKKAADQFDRGKMLQRLVELIERA